MFHVQLPSWLKARQLAMGMARNKRRYIAQVYKIPQNRLGTLHSLGVFSAVSFAKTLRAAIVTPFAQVKRSRRPQTKYRYCESVRTTSMATNASVCAEARAVVLTNRRISNSQRKCSGQVKVPGPDRFSRPGSGWNDHEFLVAAAWLRANCDRRRQKYLAGR